MEASFSSGGTELRYPDWHPSAERTEVFLRDRQAEILLALRSEIERLRRENNDLQYRLVMASRASLRQQSAEAVKRNAHNDDQPDEQRHKPAHPQQPADVSELLHELAQLRRRLQITESQQQKQQHQKEKLRKVSENHDRIGDDQLQADPVSETLLDRGREQIAQPKSPINIPQMNATDDVTSDALNTNRSTQPEPATELLLLANGSQRLRLNPMRLVQAVPAGSAIDDDARAPSLDDCEQIIERLLDRINRQSKEIDRLKRAATGSCYPDISSTTRLNIRPVQHHNHHYQQQQQQQQYNLFLQSTSSSLSREDTSLSRLPAFTSAIGTRATDLRRRAQAVRGGQQQQQQQQQQQKLAPLAPPPPPLPIQIQMQPLPRPALKRQ